jgi:hypothetical protein
MAEPLPEQWEWIDGELFTGRKIQAIKSYREATGCGLADAKQAVDEREARLRQEQPDRFTVPAGKSGCFGVVLIVLSALAATAALRA